MVSMQTVPNEPESIHIYRSKQRERERERDRLPPFGEFFPCYKFYSYIVSLLTLDLRYYANDFGNSHGALIHFVQSTLEAACEQP